MSTIFQKVIDREIEADIVHDDARAVAFRDINPQAPVHILIVPRKAISRLADVEAKDADLLGHLLWVAREIAAREKLEDYRLVINNGAGAGQSVFHLHLHLLAGRPFSWPPG